MLNAALLEKLADPIDHTDIARDGEALRTTRSLYPIKDGIPQFIPSDDDLILEFGRRNFVAWRQLQDEAESSYAIRTEGHFSVEGYEPAHELRTVLSQFKGEWLDIGCGKLSLPAYMTGLDDISFFGADPMDVNPETPRQFPFVRSLGDYLPFKNESFDGTLFASSLDHCINPLWALEDAYRILRPGGALVVQETIRADNAAMKKWSEAAKYGQARFNPRHNWGFTEESLQMVIERAGFSGATFHDGKHPAERIITARK